VGKALAARLDWRFEDGDDLHPPANIAKMRDGTTLTDADRAPWLAAVAAWIDAQLAAGQSGIIACSALKRAYRATIIGDRAAVRLVYLRGSVSLIAGRLAARHGHFMPASLLTSQFETLEEPGRDENPIVVDVGARLDQIVDAIRRAVG
jgi:carbohydrate kinase (thermoresistant glucokinase family)